MAVTYAVPRHPAPTVCEKTSVRTSPSTREITVRPAMIAAPRAMPVPAPALVCMLALPNHCPVLDRHD